MENDKIKSEIKSLGFPVTVGQLKKILENYADDVSFGFRNQPIQELFEVKYADVTFVVFQEI